MSENSPASDSSEPKAPHIRAARNVLSLNIGSTRPSKTVATQTTLLHRVRARRLLRAKVVRRVKMNGHSSINTSDVSATVAAVQKACRVVDEECSVTYVGVDEASRTQIRIRTGSGASVSALQRTILDHVPFARVRARESVLDAALEAQITLPLDSERWKLARQHAAQRIEVRLIRALQVLLLLGALCVYVADVTRSGAEAAAADALAEANMSLAEA